MPLQAGHTYYFPINPKDNPHLWIILTDPDEDGKVIGVNLTTRDNSIDNTLILNVGDHPFVRRPTAVIFSRTRRIPISVLENLLAKGRAKAWDPCSSELLDRIRAGAVASDYTPCGLITYLKRTLGI